MTILGVDKLDLPGSGVAVSMTNEYHAPPSNTHISRKRDHAIAHSVDGIVKIGVSPAIAIPIFAEVNGRGQSQAPSLVVALRVWLSHWEVKAIGKFHADLRHHCSLKKEAQEQESSDHLHL